MMRREHDIIGSYEVPDNSLYGIHSLRARDNFPGQMPFNLTWYKAMGVVKEACYLTYRRFKNEAEAKFGTGTLPVSFFSDEVIKSLIESAAEVADGKHFDQFIVPAMQGGAGTSINMAVNEIVTNVALLKLGHRPGDYQMIDPFEQANVFQSTNDVVPSALKVASMWLLHDLESAINALRLQVERVENNTRNLLRSGYTQMQEAVPTSYDKLFSTYNNALSRDWWRVSKCMERIKEVNLGGGAIGTGLSIPRFFIMNVAGELQRLTNLPLTRSENLSDATANHDDLVEVHAILKAHAVNLEKMVGDLRLLGADLFKNRELQLPRKQAGSSIMPGKVNPVVPEFVISTSHKVYANDLLISNLCGQGCLELNAYLPMIGHALLESIQLLINANTALLNGVFKELSIVQSGEAEAAIYANPSVTTCLSPYIGYHQASELALEMKSRKCSVFEANNHLQLVEPALLERLLDKQNLLKLGYSLREIQ
jgi:aspartate ammonia-lyase